MFSVSLRASFFRMKSTCRHKVNPSPFYPIASYRGFYQPIQSQSQSQYTCFPYLSNLSKSQFQNQNQNQRRFTNETPKSTSNIDSTSEDTQKLDEMYRNFLEMEERTKCRHVVDAILLDPRARLPYDEYLELCKLHSLSVEQAKKLAQSLHITGIVWYFDGWFEEGKPLLIKTKEICQSFLQTVDLKGESRSQFIDHKQNELKQLLLQIKPLEEMHNKIELKSRKYVRNCWRAFFGYVIVHCMAVPYLTFWAYSWDIMEPVTYMFNLWTLFLATWFYMNTNFEFSNEGISEAIRRIKREKLCAQYQFDIKRYTDLQQQIADIEDDLLNPEWQMLKQVHPQVPDVVRSIHLEPLQLLKQYANGNGNGETDSQYKSN